MLDAINFMRKAWGGMGQMPSSFQPTVDVKEIEKRIEDLKAVEQWLNLNLNMLRGSIQAMEVQIATINAMKSMGQTVMPEPLAAAVGQAVSQGVDKAAKTATKARNTVGTSAKKIGQAVDGANAAAAWWAVLQKQFNDVTQAAMSTGLTPSKSAAKAKVAQSKQKTRQKKTTATSRTARIRTTT